MQLLDVLAGGAMGFASVELARLIRRRASKRATTPTVIPISGDRVVAGFIQNAAESHLCGDCGEDVHTGVFWNDGSFGCPSCAEKH